MTNSTDSKTEDKDKKKKKKAQGPIRTGAVVSALVVSVLIYLYGVFFFDSNLRAGLSWAIAYVHGAEVNIAKVETSIFNAYFRLYGLEITDKEEPSKNLVKIGYVNFDLLWDALLRAKFVVNAAEIQNIEAFSKRRRPGWVKSAEDAENKEPTVVDEVQKNVLAQAKDDYSNNILGDISSLMSGTKQGDHLDKMKADLKSEKRAKELELELDQKSKSWEDRFDNLPKPEEIEAIAKEIQNHKVDTKNFIQGAKDLQKLNKLLEKAKKKIDAYNKASKDLKKDVKGFEKDIKNLENLAKQDIKDLQKRFKIPSVDSAEFTKKIFTRMIMEKLAGYKKYIDVGKQYMPPPKTAEEKEPSIVPRKRGEGKNISFPITKKGYPLFWLKKAVISSKSNRENPYSGDISGKIINITSHPKYLGKPAVIRVRGGFPGLKVEGINTKIVIDNTKTESLATIDSVVKRFPVGEKMFSNSKSVKFGYKSAVGTNTIKGESRGDRLDIKIDNRFQKVDYITEAHNKDLALILSNTVKKMPALSLVAKVGGTWSNIKLGIDSNLGRELSKGVKQQVQARINAEKKKLEDKVFGPYKKQKAKLESKFSVIKGDLDKKVEGQKQKLNEAQSQAKSSLNNKKESTNKSSAKKKQKKLLKDLKKKFKL